MKKTASKTAASHRNVKCRSAAAVSCEITSVRAALRRRVTADSRATGSRWLDVNSDVNIGHRVYAVTRARADEPVQELYGRAVIL